MTPRIAAGLALAALLAAVLWRGAAVSAPPASPPAKPAGKGPAAQRPAAEPKHLARDPFRYADARPVLREPAPQVPKPAATPLAPVAAPEPPIRLSGFARRSGVLKAVLNLLGSVVVVGPGEVVEGYRVIGVDEERGVRLQQPDGTEITLVPSDR